MGLETATTIPGLVATWPLDSDLESQGAAHLRMLKSVLQSSFVNNFPGLQPGMLMPYAAAAAPSGWLLCFGQNVSRTAYSALFAVISTTYGVGDGSTTFGIPDMRGRVAAGKDNMGGTAANRLTIAGGGIDGATLGAAGGGQSVVLGVTNLPAHTHAVGTLVNSNDSPDHAHNVNGIPTGGRSATHAHSTTDGGSFTTNASGVNNLGIGSGNRGLIVATGADNADHSHALGNSNTAGATARHSHTISGATDAGSGTGVAVPTPQPTQIFNYIIYAGA